eukprot:2575578-Ditylum_brightwellii.AAC.1
MQQPSKKNKKGYLKNDVGADGENIGSSDFVSVVERGWYHGNTCGNVGGGDGGYMKGNSSWREVAPAAA